MPKNKNYEIVKDYYINCREPEACDFYNKWMTHKYRHTMTVVKVGREIIKNEPVLNDLPTKIKDDFIYACLFHDLARAYEIDPVTGNHILKNHGLQAAKKLWELGETSLYILLPVLVHDQINSMCLSLSLFELENTSLYDDMPSEDKKFLQDIRQKFYMLDKEEKNIIEQGIRLVRDADMLANLRHFEKMVVLLKEPFVSEISPLILNNFYKGRLVLREYASSYVDWYCTIISWGGEIYNQYALQCVLRENIFDIIKNSFIEFSTKHKVSESQQNLILQALDKGISAIKTKMQSRIK